MKNECYFNGFLIYTFKGLKKLTIIKWTWIYIINEQGFICPWKLFFQ